MLLDFPARSLVADDQFVQTLGADKKKYGETEFWTFARVGSKFGASKQVSWTWVGHTSLLVY